MKNKIVLKMTISSMFIAITYLLTTFASIPFPSGNGYINFGDAIILLSSIVLGPFYGAFIGSVAGALADLSLGGFLFIPFTIIAKAGEALISGLLHKVFPSFLSWLAYSIGALWMIAIYFLCYLFLYGNAALIGSLFDLVQGTIGVIMAIVLEKIYLKIYKTNVSNT